MTKPFSDEDILDRMVRAVEKVRERLHRTVRALEDAKIPYAVTGGNAVAAWVARVDEAAVRNTPDIDILLGRLRLRVRPIRSVESRFRASTRQWDRDVSRRAGREGPRCGPHHLRR